MMRYALLRLLYIAMFCLARAAHAQSCSATASAVNFGNVDPIRLSAVSTTGTIAVTCSWPTRTSTPKALVCLSLNAASPRSLKNGGHSMQYDLYQNAAHSLAWGSVANGTTPISLKLTKPATGNSTTQTVTLYGQIASDQPSVPTVGNSRTSFTESFAGTTTALEYGFYASKPPSCTSLASAGRFSLSVSATVIPDCVISASNLDFPATTVLSKALSTTGSITARCTQGNAWRIALSGGASGNPAARRMQRAGGGGVIDYQLYTNSTRTTIWGDGTSGTTMETGTGTGGSAVITVYGYVPAQATPAPGSYSDSITATISF